MASGPPVWTLGGHTRNIFFTFFFGNGLRVLCSISLCLLSTTCSAFAGVVSALERLVEESLLLSDADADVDADAAAVSAFRFKFESIALKSILVFNMCLCMLQCGRW